MGQRLWDACSVIWAIFVVSENKQFSLLCNVPKTCVLTLLNLCYHKEEFKLSETVKLLIAKTSLQRPYEQQNNTDTMPAI